jgi:tetratricopeptide (TPR) repeat protein
MSELLGAVRSARAEGRDPAMAAFLAAAPSNVIRAAWLLAVTVELGPSELVAIANQIWPEESFDEVVESLEKWPIVANMEGRMRASEAFAPGLAQEFASREPEDFALAHELLVRLEQAREVGEDEYQSWLIRGRIAFYLAGLQPEESVKEFGDVFASAPSYDRVAARIWVSSLVLRQEPLLHEQRRELAFYRGFRAYVMTESGAARDAFEEVVAEEKVDPYQAIALHLLGVLLRRRDSRRAVQLLEHSVALSSDLQLHENEVMARTSLAWALVARAQLAAPEGQDDFARAFEVARQTRGMAEAQGDPTLTAATRFTSAVTEWLWRTNDHISTADVSDGDVRRLADELQSVFSDAVQVNDFEAVVSAGNAAAQMLADVGRYEEALDRVEATLRYVEWLRHPPPKIVRLAKTTGSILAKAGDPIVLDRGGRLITRIDDVQDRIANSVAGFAVQTVSLENPGQSTWHELNQSEVDAS